jgi:DNA-binding LacI/PurR family transcriptional regulator
MSTSRWREITDEVRSDIERGRYRAGDRLPSSDALAEIHNVSRLTAHKALEELQREGLVTRNGRNGTVVTNRERPKTGRIAFVVDQIDHFQNFPQPRLLAGIHSGLGNDSLVLCDSKASTDREIDLLWKVAKETDGILCWPTDDSKAGEVMNELKARGVPLVLLDRIPENAQVPAVIADSVTPTRQSLEFLIGRGRERIALLTFDKPHASTVVERCGMFEAILREHDLFAPELVRRFPTSLEISDRAYLDQAVHDALFTLLNGPSPATAVFCVQDLLGYAVLASAEKMELKMPDDLEVVTFNDWPPHWLHHPWEAHRISIQPDEMGRAAIANLRDQMAGLAGGGQAIRIPAVFIDADRLLTPSFDIQRTKDK